ncbi:MAG: DUF423 domain-containing protein [Dehalococcoidia bacterium]|nr:MAG: DUF423 domain-containing protein [Dehalococcoidia bacterium]
MGSAARSFGIAGAVLAGVAVAAGAFGAHALRNLLPADRLDVFETAVRYQMYHGLALLAVAWIADRRPSRLVAVAGVAFALGIVLFSGSLAALALTGQRWLGAVAPFGGACFLLGWGVFAWAIGAARHGD